MIEVYLEKVESSVNKIDLWIDGVEWKVQKYEQISEYLIELITVI